VSTQFLYPNPTSLIFHGWILLIILKTRESLIEALLSLLLIESSLQQMLNLRIKKITRIDHSIGLNFLKS